MSELETSPSRSVSGALIGVIAVALLIGVGGLVWTYVLASRLTRQEAALNAANEQSAKLAAELAHKILPEGGYPEAAGCPYCGRRPNEIGDPAEVVKVERIPLCAECGVVPGWGECSSRFCYGCCADAKHDCDKTCSDDPPARSL